MRKIARKSRHSRRTLIVSLSVVGALLVAAAIGIVIVNVAILPGTIDRLEQEVSSEDNILLEIGGASYLPLRGVVFRQVRVHLYPPEQNLLPEMMLMSPRVRVSLSRDLIGARDSLQDLNMPEFTASRAVPALLDAFAELAARNLLPRRVVMDQPALMPVLPDGSSPTFATHRLRVTHRPGASRVTISGTASPAAPVAAEILIGYADREFSGYVEAARFTLERLPLASGDVSGHLEFEMSTDQSIRLDGALSLSNAVLQVPAITDEPIDNLKVNYAFGATLYPQAEAGARWPNPPESSRILTNKTPWTLPATPPAGRLIFTSGELRVNDLHGVAIPEFYGIFDDPTVLAMKVHLPPTPVSAVLANLPTAVGGAVTRTATAGTFGWDLSVWVPLESVVDMVWNTVPVLSDFAVLEIDPSVNVYRLNEEFAHTIVDEGVGFRRTVLIPEAKPASIEWMLAHSEHTRRQIERIRTENEALESGRPPVVELPAVTPAVAAGSPSVAVDAEYRYVYVDDMSPWVVSAVLTAEDGDFFFYGGVNPVTLADAIALNVAAGEILYGASTISMQVVKMLFLDQQRVFSRKAQELFLVYLMEHQVPVSKERILELYINLAEFGPGIFGIYDAARLYFGKHPRDLTPGEAVWLASILPSPKTYYREFEQGRVSNQSFGRMIDLFDIMRERGRMTSAEHRLAVTRRPRFAP